MFGRETQRVHAMLYNNIIEQELELRYAKV
jgi:hypothetical protein